MDAPLRSSAVSLQVSQVGAAGSSPDSTGASRLALAALSALAPRASSTPTAPGGRCDLPPTSTARQRVSSCASSRKRRQQRAARDSEWRDSQRNTCSRTSSDSAAKGSGTGPARDRDGLSGTSPGRRKRTTSPIPPGQDCARLE